MDGLIGLGYLLFTKDGRAWAKRTFSFGLLGREPAPKPAIQHACCIDPKCLGHYGDNVIVPLPEMFAVLAA
jgi:hypothetical protein